MESNAEVNETRKIDANDPPVRFLQCPQVIFEATSQVDGRYYLECS